jgi:hypothetical protein
MPVGAIERLRVEAEEDLSGRIRCFGSWSGDFGSPLDWHRNPLTGARRVSDAPASRMVADDPAVGDVKLMWEVGRFPQAFRIARAAAFTPDQSARLATGLADQIARFISSNPVGVGIHWNSGQEIAIRSVAWLFALDTLLLNQAIPDASVRVIEDSLRAHTDCVQQHLAFAKIAVNNNHLIAEALLLFVAGALLAGDTHARTLREQGHQILVGEARRQFHPDGGYLNLSHNYHRVVLQHLLLACVVARSTGHGVDASWTSALARSVDFLSAHLNPADGRLPNYGSNDGSHPSVMSTCDFSDYRPTLQAASVACRGERLFEPGPWDEEAAWLFGPSCLDLPIRGPARRSVSFAWTGFHVLRSEVDERTFLSFRCGTVRVPFSQIDMLHLDLFWRGENVLVDGGSYLYNGPREWHEHFLRTGSHNTISVDGRDQMTHHRRFRNLYLTQATLRASERSGSWSVVSGEHSGFRRHPGGCVHRRTVAFHESGLGVVRDTVLGTGRHHVRLHWLAGAFPWTFDRARATLMLDTPQGGFALAMRLVDGRIPEADVVEGQTSPPRGWQSRYYAAKVPTPSCATTLVDVCPVELFTVFGPAGFEVAVDAGEIQVTSGGILHRLALSADHMLRIL